MCHERVESIGMTRQHDDFRRLTQQKYPDTLAGGSDFKSPNFVVVGPGPQIKMSYSILSAKTVGIGLHTGTHRPELVHELTTLFSFDANELAIKTEVRLLVSMAIEGLYRAVGATLRESVGQCEAVLEVGDRDDVPVLKLGTLRVTSTDMDEELNPEATPFTPRLNTSWPFFPFMHDSIHLIFTPGAQSHCSLTSYGPGAPPLSLQGPYDVMLSVTPCLNTNGPSRSCMTVSTSFSCLVENHAVHPAVTSYGPGAPPLSLQRPYDVMLSGTPCIFFIPLDVGHQTKSLQ
ncbi:hypothetical protein BU17DRAFT_63945 [Hysterangium stoloniferum]|nr:hypothetical protein BU17DRAFT_63945 [Hysterangium stoloniferum]